MRRRGESQITRGKLALFSAIAISGGLLLLEGSVRLFVPPPEPATYREHRQVIEVLGLPALNDIMEFDPVLFWRLRPELRNHRVAGKVRAHEIDFSVTTHAGLRSDPVPETKRGFRVLALGDSCTFGVGVDNDETWCVGEAGPAARSIFTFGAPRESQIAHDFAWRPDVPPPEACEPFHKGKTRGFVANFELRRASGGNLFEQASAKPEFAVWVRHLDDEGVDPTASFRALADSLPPAAMVVFPTPAMISTMTWSVDFDRPPTARGGWRLLWASSENSADGYSLQNMAVWNADGERLAVARQVVAIFT